MSNQLQAPIIDTTVKKYEWNNALLQGTYQVYYNILNDDESLNPILFYSITDINTNITTYYYGQTTSLTFTSKSDFLIKIAYMDIEDLESGDKPGDYDLHQKDESFLVSYKDEISPWSNKLVISPMTSTPSCSVFINNEVLSNTINYKPYELMDVKIIFTDPVFPFDLKVLNSGNDILESAFDLGDYGQKQFVYSFKTRFFDVSLNHNFIKLAISYQTLDGYSREQNFIINLKQYSEFADSDKNWELEIKSSYGINAISLNPLQDGVDSDILESQDSNIGNKLVPMNAASAKVTKIGGMTRKCANLIKNFTSDSSVASIGVTQSVTADSNKITIKGTATSSGGRFAFVSVSNITLPAGTYTFSVTATGTYQAGTAVYLNSKTDGSVFKGANIGSFATLNITETTELTIGVNVVSGAYDCVIYPMINEGSAALPYEDYYSELRNALVTEIKSIGTNIWNEKEVATLLGATEDGNYYKFRSTDKILTTYPFKAHTAYTLTYTGMTDGNGRIQATYTDGTTITRTLGSETEVTRTFTTDATKTVAYFKVTYGSAGFTWLKKGGVMLNEGATALSYEPYTETILTIPAAVRALNGYGLGVDDTYYNYIHYDELGKATYVQWCKKIVFNGTEQWSPVQSGDGAPYFRYTMSNDVTIDKHIQNHFRSAKEIALSNSVTGARVYRSYVQNIGFYNVRPENYSEYANEDEWKAQLATWYANGEPLTLVYTLAEPIITDISFILSDDNWLDIVPGGHIVFENEYGYSVPNTVEYQLYLNQILVERNNKPLICSPSTTSAYLDFLGDPFSNYKATLINDSTSKYFIVNQFTQLNTIEHMALVDKDSYLQIKFNPEITNIKKNLNESVVATLGGNYPYVRRNGNIKYRQFQIGGLISYWALNEGENLNLGNLLQLINISRNSYSSYPANDREVLLEREFREKVLDFLYKDNVKLFMSNEEGKMLVKLTNITLTPMKQLGRRIYSFSAQATEVDDVENLAKYDIPHGLPVSFS